MKDSKMNMVVYDKDHIEDDVLMKNEWEKPKMIVVVRGSAEEKVLMACKLPVGMAAMPQTYDMTCVGSIQSCLEQCDTIAGS
jgi:hypothetical protein